jgi:hypothetical protein
MKYAKAIVLSIALGALLDILIDIIVPDSVMNVIFVVTVSVLLVGILLVAFLAPSQRIGGASIYSL